MPQPERVFLDWSVPTARAAAQWLVARAASQHGVDLSDTLVVAPTRQAVRRLREELANSSPGGVLSPRTITPAQFLQPDAENIAGSLEAIVIFLDVFEKFPAARLSALFPNGVPFRTLEERTHFTQTFFELRASLADANWTLRAAARQLGEHVDLDRWEALAQLEQAHLDALRRAGRRDRESARMELAAAAPIPETVSNIVIAGLADLTPLAARALSSLPANMAVHILIAAPGELSGCFDEWGRPLAGEWQDRDPGWDDFDAQVHLCARGEDIAATLGALLPGDAKPDPAFLEIGALDRELLPSLRAPIEAAGGSLHDPEGQSLDLHWLGRLLGDWADFLADPAFNAVGSLLRNGIIASWLSRKARGFDLADALAEFDKIRADFFPSAAENAVQKCKAGRSLRSALELLLKLRSRMTGRSWTESLRAFLDEVSTDMKDGASIEAATALAEALDGIVPLVPRHPEIKPPDWLRLVRGSLATQQHYTETEPEAVEASGWLELPWSDAPHLVLAGFNQGVVPSRFAQDPFLSAGIRQHLGLPTEEQRAARDAYFLARLLAMRRDGSGRVDVLVCQIDTDGAPGQPSPLLFAGSGKALPQRVQRLFAEPRPAQPDPPWEPAWHLDPTRVELKKKLRVTGFREYLACPFEFYLRFGLGMEPFDPEPAEMDARVFGTLVHETIKAFSQNPATRDLADAAKIREVISKLLDGLVEARFETPLSLPLLIQIESARQRLLAFAEVQAVEHSEGWRIAEAEISFFDHLGGRHWQIAGWDVTGQIDRIDHHEATGRWRVLDYKTSDKSEPPARMHLRGGSAATHTWPPEYAFVESQSKWWSNLQLPLYRQFLIETGVEPALVTCGYFNLPKAVSATAIVEWTDFNDDLGESALRCASGVLADIEREKFWPPNPRAAYPQNADWFHPDPGRTVAAESWLRNVPA